MSTVAKIFVILILFLSVCFFATTATLFKTRTDWKEKHLDYKKVATSEVQKLSDQLGTLQERVDALGKDVVVHKSDSDKLAAENSQLRETANAEKAKTVTAEEARDAASRLSESLNERLQSRDTSIEGLQTALDKAKGDADDALAKLAAANAEREAALLDLQKVTEDLQSSRVEYAALDERAQDLDAQLRGLRARLGDAAEFTTIAPAIDARISAVDQDEALVVLSAGRDQNVEVGYSFTVARGGKFVGKVEVIKVYPDLAGAKIKFTKDGQKIRPGDNAYTAVE